MENDKVSKEVKKFSLKSLTKKELLLLFLAGVLLIVASVPGLFSKKAPSNSTSTQKKVHNSSTSVTVNKNDSEEEEYIDFYENKLKKLLEKMEGVGKAEVMITLKSSKEQVILKDMPYTQESLNETDSNGGNRISSSSENSEKTVLITNQSGETVPYVTKELNASIEGVVVVAQGGGDGNIAASIVNAVEVLFGVPAHKVQVLRMAE